MNKRYRLLLVLGVLLMGCAPGYYEKGPSPGEATASSDEDRKWYRNPETEEEYLRRLRWMEMEEDWERRWRRF